MTGVVRPAVVGCCILGKQRMQLRAGPRPCTSRTQVAEPYAGVAFRPDGPARQMSDRGAVDFIICPVTAARSLRSVLRMTR
jgi:hypothetical protein